MHRFAATSSSEAVVPADREAVWKALTDPDLLPRLTPLLRSVHADGDLWRWELAPIPVLGLVVRPCFTERMRFTAPRAIDYSHEPPAGTTEHSGADGTYRLREVEEGTHLAISLTVHVDLPLTRLAAPAVTGGMRAVMARTGDRFSANLLQHLGVAGR